MNASGSSKSRSLVERLRGLFEQYDAAWHCDWAREAADEIERQAKIIEAYGYPPSLGSAETIKRQAAEIERLIKQLACDHMYSAVAGSAIGTGVCVKCSAKEPAEYERSACIWDDCDQEAVYCPGHAREFVAPELDRLRAALERAERVTGMVNALAVTTDELRRIRNAGKITFDKMVNAITTCLIDMREALSGEVEAK